MSCMMRTQIRLNPEWRVLEVTLPSFLNPEHYGRGKTVNVLLLPSGVVALVPDAVAEEIVRRAVEKIECGVPLD